MVQQSKYNNYDVKDLETLATTERPVAGQSLTDNPEQQYPWEGPTKLKKGIVPSEIKEKVEAFVPPERPSLLAKPEVEVEVETPRENLLDRGAA